ncbi:PAS domain S-box protein [Chondromyces apiculatus]|nr:PAS domain S-box protein [Chondromyces apiculatus]
MQTDDEARTVSNDILLERTILEQEVTRWRTRAEQAESILNTSPAAIFLFDKNEERSRTFNHAVAHMLGYGQEHVALSADGCAADRIHPDDTSRIALEIERDLESLRDGEQLVFEYRMRHRSGEWRWLEARCVVFSRTSEGALDRYVGAVQDITERKHMAQTMRDREAALQRANADLEHRIAERTAELRRKSALLESMINNLPAAFHVKDAEGKFLLVNRRSAELMGLSRAEAVGKSVSDLLPANDAARWAEHERRILEGAEHEVEEIFEHEDGPHIYLSIGFPIRDAEGAVFAIGGFSTDITERKRAEQEREQLHARVIEAQRAAIRELSTPLIPLARGVVVMPLVGTIDSSRAQQIMESLLDGVVDQQARVAILDLTGLATVDTQIADALLRAARATRLLGAEVMLTGIKPQFAQVLVQLGIDMSGITTEGTLQSGVAAAMGWLQGRRRKPQETTEARD